MQKQLVIAKYKEDISWAKNLDSWDVVIYSKDRSETDSQCVSLPNLGREAHTYLFHILNNYEKLADVLVFAQGHPFDHSPNFLNHLQNLPQNLTYFPLSIHDFLLDELGNPHLTGNPPTTYGLNFKQFFEHVLGRPCPILMYCVGNALFAVSKERILAHPKEFYEKCLHTITCLESPTSSRVDQNIMEAHYFERLWHAIFYPGGSLPTHPAKQEMLLPLIQEYQSARDRGEVEASARLLGTMNEILTSFRNR